MPSPFPKVLVDSLVVFNCTEMCGQQLAHQLTGWHRNTLVAIISPWLRIDEIDLTERLHAGARVFKHPNTKVVGFPITNEDSSWHWPVRDIRHQFWKLHYRQRHVPGGHIHVEGQDCFAGQTTSSTRIFRLSTLRQLSFAFDPKFEGGHASWLVAMDLAAKNKKIEMHTCVADPLPERMYTNFAVLTPFLSQQFQVEAARFSLQETQIQCLGRGTYASVERLGLVRGWCERKSMEQKWVREDSTWLQMDPRNFLCAAHGAFMDLFRGGHAGMMPWDNDIDSVQCSTAPPQSGHIRDTSRAGLTLNDFPYRYILHGHLEVRFSKYWLEHHFFKQRSRYQNIAIKMHPYRDNKTDEFQFRALKCDMEHNACLPTCSPTFCEFDDHFVYPDVWEESPHWTS
eukprot:gnl/MRDRNA2_/MRDRNA2_226729_c0_seq1.p1 gnl/MRDRNA2_/MRDRNA2_226729_c0~~gnl/MRDRNA2_/MRDRNA2_226729_c0_seq1.p1  ORF type:complete len:423 (+),score=46.90 gnl/MRDRNA2_/MRDRNA2_226729_c0_seq1:76-1269(+)